MLELGSFLNNNRWTVQVRVAHKTENEMCNVRVHNVMFIELILFNILPLTAGRRVVYRSLRIANLSVSDK